MPRTVICRCAYDAGRRQCTRKCGAAELCRLERGIPGRPLRLTPGVDTGADCSTIPASLLDRLGVAPLERMRFIRDDGSRGEYGISIDR